MTSRGFFKTSYIPVRQHVLLTLTTVFFFLFIVQAQAVASNLPNQPQTSFLPTPSPPPVIIPRPPSIAANAYLLTEVNSGAVLTQKNIHQRIEPASLTKLMTLYLIADALKKGHIHLDDLVRISTHAWHAQGSRMFLNPRKKVSVRLLIQGIIVDSGNDACVAIAEYIAGSETAFVDLMNQTAFQLGMHHTHFTNPTGFPNPHHNTTVYDLAVLTRALIQNFPQYRSWYKQKSLRYNKILQHNRNRLLWIDDRVDGLKTGHTEAAGYCLIASAHNNQSRFIAIVAHSKSNMARTQSSEALLAYAFRFYETYKLYSAGDTIFKPKVYLGRYGDAPLGLKHDLFVTLPRSSRSRLQITHKLDHSPLLAPLKSDQTYGMLTVKLDDHIVTQRPLIALQNNPKGRPIEQLVDRFRLLWH